MFWTKTRNIFLIALLCCSLWGSAAPFIKKGYELFAIESNDVATILVFAGLRFLLAGILVLLIDRIIYPKREKDHIAFGHIAILAFFQTAGQYFFYYVGLAYTSGVNASIICGMGSFFALLFACYLFRSERMTRFKLIGVILGFAGIVCMNLGSDHSQGNWLGNVFVCSSQICSALSTCFINRFTQVEDPVQLSGRQFCLGGVVLILCGLFMGGHIPIGSISAYLILIHLALVSAIAYTLWSLLLMHNPVSRIGIYNTLIPIVGVFLSAIILQEFDQAFTLKTWFALFLVSSGIALLMKPKEDRTVINKL